MKRLLYLTGMIIITGTAWATSSVKDDFDWGAGVINRSAVTAGTSIAGLTTQVGGAAWGINAGTSVFSGSAGSGNGTLTMSGSNNRTYFNYAVTGSVTATMGYVYQTINTNGVTGAWLGFTADFTKSLSGDAAEKIYVRMNPAAQQIGAGVATRDRTNVIDNVDKNAPLAVARGDRLIMTLTVDVAAQSATASISNVTQEVASSLTFGWTEPAIALNQLSINETAAQTIIIDSVSVIPEPVSQPSMLLAPQHKGEPLDVYICAGQSNMSGGGEKAGLPPELQAPQTNVFVFNGTGWAVMEPTKTGVGPEFSFAYDLQKTLNKPIGIVLHAAGGKSLATHWNPVLTTTNMYAELTNKVAAARQTREIHVKGMIWMQGEADCTSESNAAAYSQNLTNLIQAARTDFDSPVMPFVAGRVNPRPARYAYTNLVRAAQETCTAAPYAYVNCDDLTKVADKIHYDTAGQVELGKRFAQSILNLK